MPTWTKVVMPRASFRLPNLCANCLRPSPDTSLLLKSDRERLKAFYLVAATYEYLRIEVPFCAECAARQMRWFRLGQWLFWPALIFSLVLSVWLDLDRWQGFLLTVILALPGAWLMLHKDWVVRVSDYDHDTMTLKIKRPEYAREVAQLNNTKGVAS